MLSVIILPPTDLVCLILLLDVSANSHLMLSCSVSGLVIFDCELTLLEALSVRVLGDLT